MGNLKELTAFGGDVKKLVVKKDEKFAGDKKPVFGIDLGTTNSAISIIHEGVLPQTIKLMNGKYTMPSCVMYHHGEFVVGDEAYRCRGGENVIYSVKRMMQDVGAEVTVREGREEVTLTPAEVSAKILEGLVEQTGGIYGKVEDVVVTVPAYFNQNGVNATKEACEIAGLNLIAIANEPTSASLCYDLEPDDNGSKNVVIYDLGGGTFDVTYAKISGMDSEVEDDLADIYGFEKEGSGDSGKVVTTLAIDGDARLGGDDVDLAMLEILYKKLEAAGIDPGVFTDSYRERLILRLEDLKKTNVKGIFEFLVDTIDRNGHEVKTKALLFPEDFRDAMQRVYLKSKSILERLLTKSGVTGGTIVLVGGSTKNAWLQEFLQEDFPSFRLDNALNPDLSVSNGAAIFGKVAKFGAEGIHIFDILPITIGILDDGAVTPLVRNGTGLPAVSHRVFTTTYDDQDKLEVSIFQGNSTFREECVHLGTLHIDGIPKAPAGEPNIVVGISISTNRFMRCEVEVGGEHRELELDLSGEAGQAVKELNRTAKNVLRWRRLAEDYSEDEKVTFLTLVDAYEQSGGDTESKKAVKSFLSGHAV